MVQVNPCGDRLPCDELSLPGTESLPRSIVSPLRQRLHLSGMRGPTALAVARPAWRTSHLARRLRWPRLKPLETGYPGATRSHPVRLKG